MAVRLLIAVLMLTGPLPVRVCTCAAAARPCAPAGEPQTRSAPPAKTCGCGKRAKPSDHQPTATADKVQAREHSPADAATAHSCPDRHERDCPAVNPRPVVPATSPSLADAPTDHDLGPPVWVEPAGGRPARTTSRPVPRQFVPPVPLYISLLTLRN